MQLNSVNAGKSEVLVRKIFFFQILMLIIFQKKFFYHQIHFFPSFSPRHKGQANSTAMNNIVSSCVIINVLYMRRLLTHFRHLDKTYVMQQLSLELKTA